MPAITLPDGSVRRFEGPVSGTALAAAIGPGLAKAALAVRVDGELLDLARPIERDAAVRFVTRRDPEALELIRHDTAHVLAEAVQGLFPGTQVTIGPSIEDGFYYDFARDTPFTTEDFPAIEARMREIIAADAAFVREVWDRDEATAFFEARGEAYKAELIRDLGADQVITLYRQGGWVDLCRGPHMRGTADVGAAFRLMKVAGAYWRGDHRNPMLSRIYGTAWRDRSELDAYLHRLEEAERRDHRRIGARWTCSTSRRRRRAASSGTRRGGGCTGPARRTCAAGWTRRGMARSGRRSSWTGGCGRGRGTGRSTASTCSSRASRTRTRTWR